MKTLLTFLSLSLLSTSLFAESVEFQYLNYKDLNLKTAESGSYSWVSNCVENSLYWDKSSQSYKRSIENHTDKGAEIVEVSGNIIKTISHATYVDSKEFSEVVTTFTSENNYVRTRKTKIIFDDKTEVLRETLVEGTYKNGKVSITRYVVNGVETPRTQSVTSVSVWLDKEAMESYDAGSYEPSDIQSNMDDPSVVSFLLKNEYVCKTKTTKL